MAHVSWFIPRRWGYEEIWTGKLVRYMRAMGPRTL